MENIAIIWIRRSMRLEDNAVIAKAIAEGKRLIFIFVLDQDILVRFRNPNDRRLSFIANILIKLDNELQEMGSQLLVFHGKARDVIIRLSIALGIKSFFAEEDFEPANIKRDNDIAENLGVGSELNLVLDHLIMHPKELLKNDGTPYKVFTPYMKRFRDMLNAGSFFKYDYNLKENLASLADINKRCKEGNLMLLDLSSPQAILEQIGYQLVENPLWDVSKANYKLHEFISENLDTYAEQRNYPAINGTSRLSPYLRFGLISIRKCFKEAYNRIGQGGYSWVNELIWREFYSYLIYHFPNSVELEFQSIYRNQIPWQRDEDLFKKYTQGKTGFPIVDAGMRQILAEGWMHNRVRMIVASFLVKNLHMDWRLGEEYFAQNLMDYELASNVGGWQWSASTGADPQPYFRVFNPWLQGKKFDNEAEYIKKYVPELKSVPSEHIHKPELLRKYAAKIGYPEPVVDYASTRDSAIRIFKAIKGNEKNE
ncbi:MAG: deoxyribodipyrimidine photo-lyase [Rickettsiaceae bacterium]|nr:deoxyribodipyrimidine photo-lyase [Rickettsiaceae bacterium]